jgi:hypothetical protein
MNGQTKFILDKIKQFNIKKLLNIGFRYDSDCVIRDFIRSVGGEFHVLEIWEPNCDLMVTKRTADKVINGDARNISDLICENEYEAIIWLHGPEHISWGDFINCKNKIENCATKLVIYQAPIGPDEQGEMYNNPYELHVETLYPNMFKDLGYEVMLHDGSNIDHYNQCFGERTFSAFIEKE